jgi:nicotinamide riboside transporter PnuC
MQSRRRRNSPTTVALKWIGTSTEIAGAVLLAVNIPESAWGFVLFLISSSCWAMAGYFMGESSLVLLHLVFVGANVLGIYRWLL